MKTATAGKTRLGKATLVDRAIELADTEGLDAVTIRRLAQELGVSPMALYWHCADKDALLTAISERLWDEIAADLDAAPPAGDGWSELHRLTACLVAVLRRHLETRRNPRGHASGDEVQGNAHQVDDNHRHHARYDRLLPLRRLRVPSRCEGDQQDL